MKPKLLACDVDGTLIHNHEQYISDEDLQAIKQFRAKGNLFALCTGRTLIWTTPLIGAFHIQTDGLVLCNGSMVYKTNPENPLDIQEISNSSIPNKVGLEILEYFYHLGTYTLYWDNGQKTYEINDRPLIEVSSIIQENYSVHISIEEALQLKDNFVTIGVTPMSGSVELAEQVKTDINKRWGEYTQAFRNQYFVDIAPVSSSKGTGLKLLQTYIGDVELFGVGDSHNDLPMFQTVGKANAFLMANGDDSLAEFADTRVRTVAECIELILSEKINKFTK